MGEVHFNNPNQIKSLKKGLKFFKKNVYQLGYLNYGNRKRLSENELAFLRETWDEILKIASFVPSTPTSFTVLLRQTTQALPLHLHMLEF